MNVECLSVIPGYGKSTIAIEELRASSENDFNMVIVPLLSEIERYRDEERGVPWLVEPLPEGSQGTKFDNMKTILEEENNVITTAKMYEKVDADVIKTIKRKCRFRGKKTLYIDETLDVVSPSTIINPLDMKMFIELGLISVNEDTGKVTAERSFPSRYSNTQNVIENGLVWYLDGRYVVFEVGIDFLNAFDRVLILTHRFKTSIMYHYIKSQGVDVDFLPVDKERVEKIKSRARERIIVLEDINIDGNLSHQAFDTNPDFMKKGMNRVVKEAMDKTGVPIERTRFTFFKSFGGMDSKTVNRWVKTLKIGKGEMNEDGTPKAFLSHTIKATNDHSNCVLMLWGIDKHINPGIPQYFSERGQKMNRREWSLSQLIQWVWRSNIRVEDSDEKVYVVIPHEKSRNEFIRWLNSEENEEVEPKTSSRKASDNQRFAKFLKNNPHLGDKVSIDEFLKDGAVKTKKRFK